MKHLMTTALVASVAFVAPFSAAQAEEINVVMFGMPYTCLLYTSPSPRDS